MKKAFKLFKIFIITVFSLIIFLLIIAKVKENEITEIVLQKITESTHVPIIVNDISLNLIRRFPYSTITLRNVWVGNCTQESVFQGNDTLAFFEKVYVSVKSMPLFNGEIEILKIEIKGIDFNYIVNKEGINNLYFLESDSQNDSSLNPEILLKELLLKDLHCTYSDSLKKIRANLLIPKVEISGSIKNDYMYGAVKGNLKLSDLNYKASNLCLLQEYEIDYEMTYSEDTINIKKIIVSTDGADIEITGNTIIKDTIETDIEIKGTEIDLEKMAQYIPGKLIDELNLKKITGIIDTKATIKGNIYDSILPEVKMDVILKKGSVQCSELPLIENISFNAYITNGKQKNNSTTKIILKKCHADSKPGSIDLNINILNLEKIQYDISSDISLDITALKEFIPDSFLYDVNGNISASFSNKGTLPDTFKVNYINDILETCKLNLKLNSISLVKDSIQTLDSLSGEIAYNLYNCTARYFKAFLPEYNLKINNSSVDARFSGKINDLSNAEIDIKSFQIKTDSSIIFGSVNIQNFKNPEFKIKSDSKINLKEIKPWFDTLVKDISGEITSSISSHGTLNYDSISEQISNIVFNKSEFVINLNKVTTDLDNTLYNIKELSGELHVKPDTLKINNTHGIYQDVNFNIDSTIIVNINKSVLKNQPVQLYAEGKFNLGDIDYAMFVPFIKSNDTVLISKMENDSLSLEDSVSVLSGFSYLFKGKIDVNSMTYKNATIKNISGMFRVSDSIYIIDQFKFDGFGGKLNTSVRYEKKDNNEDILWVKNSIEKMNVNRLLKDFNNFKDFYKPAITFNNLSGIFSSKIDAQIYFKNGSMIRKKMYVRGDDIKLEKGGIYNYQPVKDMAEYLPGIDNLDILEFKTINSKIFVFQDTVYVPSTFIVSNKLDASALGLQTLGGDYSYHFKVYMSDILTSKNPKINKKQDKIGDVISSSDRKGGILVKSYSINGKSKSGLDNKIDQLNMSINVKTSNTQLLLRFNPYNINYDTGVK